MRLNSFAYIPLTCSFLRKFFLNGKTEVLKDLSEFELILREKKDKINNSDYDKLIFSISEIFDYNSKMLNDDDKINLVLLY